LRPRGAHEAGEWCWPNGIDRHRQGPRGLRSTRRQPLWRHMVFERRSAMRKGKRDARQ
ncbi:hypothetical protein HK405_010695, partial [Cladochytrium tenue]